MDYKVIWSPEATEDLATVANYIAKDSEFYAWRLVLTLLGWDIERSYVRDEFLSTKIEFNKNWKSNRRILSQKYVTV